MGVNAERWTAHCIMHVQLHRIIITDTSVSFRLIFSALNFSLTLTCRIVLLLPLLVTYFRISGYRYTQNVLTNQNYFYITHLHD